MVGGKIAIWGLQGVFWILDFGCLEGGGEGVLVCEQLGGLVVLDE